MKQTLFIFLCWTTHLFADWPSWRGPGGTGIGSGSPPTQWNIKTGSNVLWKTDIPGLAHSSPIVTAQYVFLTTALSSEKSPALKVGLYGSGDSPSEDSAWSWQVLCLERKTGKILWTQTAHQGKPKQKRHTKATHANCTPVTAHNFVVALFGSEGIFCYDLKGTLQWKSDLGLLRAGPYHAPEFEWGFASSPVIHQNEVIVQCDVLNGGFISVLDLKTGRERLRIPREEVATWSTPLVHESRIVCNGYKQIGAYDLISGKQIWWLKGGGDIPVPTPFEHKGLIYISNAHGKMNPIYAIHPDAQGDLTPARTGPAPEGIAWWNPRRGSYIPTPVAYDGHLYIGNDRGILTCLNARTGEEMYRERLSENQGESYSASPVAADGKIFFTSERGNIHLIEAGPKFRRLQTNPMEEICMATPAIDAGQIFLRTRTTLYCIGK